MTDLLQGTPNRELRIRRGPLGCWASARPERKLIERLRLLPDSNGFRQPSRNRWWRRLLDKVQRLAREVRAPQRPALENSQSRPSWKTRVSPSALMLQSMDATDPRVSQEKATGSREQVQRDFEQRLRDPEIITRFRELLAAAEPYLGVRESRDHATNMAFTAIRLPALEPWSPN